MSFDPSKYPVGINLGEYFVDKDTGLPLSGGKIYFKKDTNRSVGKYVYQLVGTPPSYSYEPLPNPITLSSVGTIVDEFGNNIAVYYYPYDENGNLDLYYVQVTDSAGIAGGNIQLERQAWPNISLDLNPTDAESGETGNQILNPQFSDIYFEQESGILLEWTGAITNRVFPIGPGWNLIVSASDTSSIQIDRLELEGSLNINTNPPYALTILPEGAAISSIKLRQIFSDNPSIWANNTLSGFMLIASLDSLSHTVEMTYGTSVPNIPQTVITAATGTTGYVSAVGTVDIGAGANTDSPPEGFTYIDILLPRTGFVAISSIQIVTVQPNTGAAAYIQNSINQQKSDLFYYYNPLIQQVPVPSILQGWDFPVNPIQFNTPSMGAVASQYLWDNLIGWQSVNSMVSASRAPAGELIITRLLTGQFALVQYLSASQMNELLLNDFSVLINAYTNLVAGASGTVSFWYTTDVMLPNVAAGTNLSLISTLDANGKPATFHGTWTELSRNYRGDGRFTIPYNANAEPQSISLQGWNYAGNTIGGSATYVAIVVGFSSTDASAVVFDSISVTPGNLARPVAPLSYELTRKELEFYYEKSYSAGIYPGAVTNTSVLLRPQVTTTKNVMVNLVSGAGLASGYQYSIGSFGIDFRSMKREVPNLSLYSSVGTLNSVSYVIDNISTTAIATTNWTPNVGQYGAWFEITSGAVIADNATLSCSEIIFHYVADARLGIVL